MRSTLLAFVLLVIVAACSPAANTPQDANSNNRINVVATTGMIADVVQNVGGERVNVTQLMGPGVDPHLYSATESDVTTLTDAQMIFYNGLNLEARLTEIFEQIGQNKPVIAVGAALPADRVVNEVGRDITDPHVWMDVELWSLVAQEIADELAAFDAANASLYQANATAYREQLAELDQYAQDQINRVPTEQRVLVTAHDAFHYFSRAYGIEVFAPQGITTAAEAGVEDIRRIIEIVVQRKIPAIFVETSVPPDVIEAIIAGAEAQGQTVSVGGSLFSDAMGEAGTPEGSYIGMIRHNIDTIVTALLGLPSE
ncbi:MAG: zinc ABC transporter substrate-binding protein [Anaerolineae bacterium]|nr:zinc ABC transporter substrate-binding protein [Anaerolineae bacterium]